MSIARSVALNGDLEFAGRLRSALLAVLLSAASLMALAGTFAATAGASPGFAYVVNYGGNSVTPIDLATGEAGNEIKVGFAPRAVAITPDGKTAYVTNSENVTPIELATGKAGAEIKVSGNLTGIAITPDGKTAYVAGGEFANVTPIELATNTPGKEIKVGESPYGIAITPDGKTAYVTNSFLPCCSSESMTPIEVATNTPREEIKVGKRPGAIAITPDGKTAYVVTNGSPGTVTPIELATGKAGKEIKAGPDPTSIAITPDGKTAYVVNNLPPGLAGTVTPIELATNTPGEAIKVGEHPAGIAITPDGKTAYVTNKGSNSVTTIEVATNTAGKEIKVGDLPEGIAITPGYSGFEQITGSPFSNERSTSIAFSPEGGLLATANPSANNVSMFSVNQATGALTAVTGSPFSTTPGSAPQSVSFYSFAIYGLLLATANTGNNTVSLFKVNEKTEALESPTAVANTGREPRSVAFNFVNPEEPLLATADSGSGDVSVFSLSELEGGASLTPVPGSPFAAGSHTRSVAFDPASLLEPADNLLAAGNESGSISMYRVNEITGALTPVADSPFATPGGSLNSIAFNATGTLLAAATSEGVDVYSINSATGALTAVAGSPFASGGNDPYSVAFNPNGETLAIANAKGSSISILSVNQATGALTQAPGSPFEALTEPQSLAFNPEGDLLASVGDAKGVALFNTLPVATIKPPAAVTKTSATLQATVNTNGLDASEYSECEFEYGETTAYGSSVPCTPASGSKAPTAISAAVTGLKAGTKYHYRAYFNYVAGGDPKARTRDEEFETAPNTAFKCAQGALFASGSGFQGAVQSVFREHYVATKADSLCEEPPPPTTTYTPTLSAAGLEAFGAGNAEDKFAEELLNRKDTTIKGLEERKEACGPEIVKAAAKGEASGKCLDLFIGTDDAPTPTQLANMTKAAGGKTGHLPAGGGTKENRGAVVVPVAQGPITVMLSLPAGCRIKGGNKVELSNVALGQIYEGENLPKIGSDPGGIEPQGGYGYATWGALLTQLGYAKVAKESGLGAASFYDAGTAEETLQRYSATNEKVKVHSKAQIEKGEGEETVELKNSKRETVKGEGCAAKIKPQVRATEAGTSYALKAYLNQIDSYVWKGFASEALSWPTPNVLQQNQSSSTKEALKQETDAQIAEATAATPGSVGYAEALDAVKAGATSGEAASTQRPYPSTDTIEEVLEEGEAENQKTKAKEKIRTRETVPVKSISHEILYAQLQNNGTQKPAKSSEFASPLLTADKANCETTKLVAGDQSYPLHWNGSWNGVLASDPDVAKVNAADYPLCAFSYAVAWHHYSNKALYGHETSKEEENAKKIAATVKDYFEYMTYTGPTDLTNSGFFTGPPAEMESHITVAVKNIGY